MTRILRCAGCTRRIKDHHAHVGLIDLEAGQEFSYHAKQSCQRRAAQHGGAMAGRGKAYILRHYHASTCSDEAPGWGCAGGCFSGVPEAVAN